MYIDLEGSTGDFEIVDLGEKAKKLVRLSARTEVFVLYNLTGVAFTKPLMLKVKSLMEHASLVSRRVIFGADARYDELVRQIIHNLGLSATTRFASAYPQALNILADDGEWRERRLNGMPASVAPGWTGQERRLDPAKFPTEAELQAKMDKLFGK
jgi:hypothetical protein